MKRDWFKVLATCWSCWTRWNKIQYYNLDATKFVPIKELNTDRIMKKISCDSAEYAIFLFCREQQRQD